MLCVKIKQARCTCFVTKESESCLVKAPAKQASESVLVVGELLCTGVQANTETHKEGNARNVLMLGIQHSSSRKSGEWRDSNLQQSSRLANLGSYKRHLKSFSRSKGLAKPEIHQFPAIRAASLNPRRSEECRPHTDTCLFWRSVAQKSCHANSPLALSRSFIRIGHRQSFCVEEFKIIVGFQQLHRTM